MLQVVAALSAACGLLLIRTVFGLLSIDHPKFTNQPRLQYTLEVLPELLALYIVAAPGIMPAVGRDADQQQHKPGTSWGNTAVRKRTCLTCTTTHHSRHGFARLGLCASVGRL